MAAVTEVGTEENQHLTWARQTRTRMVQLRASCSVMTAAGAKVEELTETVRGWFSS